DQAGERGGQVCEQAEWKRFAHGGLWVIWPSICRRAGVSPTAQVGRRGWRRHLRLQNDRYKAYSCQVALDQAQVQENYRVGAKCFQPVKREAPPMELFCAYSENLDLEPAHIHSRVLAVGERRQKRLLQCGRRSQTGVHPNTSGLT